MIGQRDLSPEARFMTTVERLRTYDLVYLATPYTKYAAGLDAAADHATRIAGRLVEDGVRVFAPIPYSVALREHCAIDALDHDFWLEFDTGFMAACDALAIAQMPGWKQSDGVQQEIEHFNARCLPLHFLTVDWLLTETGCEEPSPDADALYACDMEEALAAYASDEDRYLAGNGEAYGSIPTEVGIVARNARSRVVHRESMKAALDDVYRDEVARRGVTAEHTKEGGGS